MDTTESSVWLDDIMKAVRSMREALDSIERLAYRIDMDCCLYERSLNHNDFLVARNHED